MEIAAGVSDVVLVGGAERVLNVSTEESTEYFAYASDAVWEQTLGLTFPGVFALIARAHMAKYGTTEAQMAAVAVKNHRHGVLNPKAQFQKEITLEQVLKSRVRGRSAQALRLLPVHRRRRRPRARLRGGRPQAPARRSGCWPRRPPPTGCCSATSAISPGCRPPSGRRRRPTARPGSGPTDVDVVELHDCFTIAEIVATEGLGLFEPGAGGVAAEKGWTSLGGKIPGQPLGRAQGQGASRSAPPAPPRSPRSSPSCAARPARGRSTAPRTGSPTPSAATPRPCS